MEENKDTVYRWYEMSRYDENVPNGDKGKIQMNLEQTFLSLLNSLRGMAKEFEISGFERITLEEASKVCEEQKISLSDYLGNIFEEYLEENEENKENTLAKMAQTAESYIDSNIPPQVKAYVQCYMDSFAEYGPGARDNVVTAMVISGGVQQPGEENVPYSTNALYGCGFGKTTVSKGVAMGKLAIGKRSVITSSTPELAGQSFGDLKEGFAQRKISVLYYSENKVIFLDTNGEEKELSEEEIEAAFKDAGVIVSDLTSLVKAKETGKYIPDRDRDSLLQDEQDSDMFHNLWSVEIKGEEYSNEEHNIRLAARSKADQIVQIFMNNNPDKVIGNKVKQSVSIEGRPPKIEVKGNSVTLEGISINVPGEIEANEFAEFIMDSLFARGLYTDKGKDYVVKDGKIEAISPSTGGINNIPEGVIQALAIKEGIDSVQTERKVEKVASKMTFIKESFGEISGMSATYGMDPKQFLEVVSSMGLSPDLIEVMPLIKKGRLPNLENLTEEERKVQSCKVNAEKTEDLQVIIGTGENTRTVQCSSPQMAAIIKDIEAHQGESIIIGTDDREKTIEIVRELSRIYGEDKEVEGYSSVQDKDGDPKLELPPNPANDERLKIGVGKIVVGDHCIGRGVTPSKNDSDKGTNEHLIMAQMPSRSEGLLEQFLGRVGRKKDDGSISFILQEDDGILEEFRKLNDGKEPEDILEITESVYPEKTKDAIEATKGDIDIGLQQYGNKVDIIEQILARYGYMSLEEAKDDKGVISKIEGSLEFFDKKMKLMTKQFKGTLPRTIDVHEILEEYENTIEISNSNERKGNNENQDKRQEIEETTASSRYSQIKGRYERLRSIHDLIKQGQIDEVVKENSGGREDDL